MRSLAAVALIVTTVAGPAWGQHASHAGFSGHAASPSHGRMSSPSPGRFQAPRGGMSGPGLGRFAAPPRSPGTRAPYTGIRTPYSGIRMPYAGNRGPNASYGASRTGFSRLNPTPGGRHTGQDGPPTQFGGAPSSGHSNWGDRDRDRVHEHHRVPYWAGNGLGYGYGISGWYLSPYVLGDPGALAYGNWGTYGANGDNRVPYADNYGPDNPYAYGGAQGYGPEPGYQGAENPLPGYQEPSYQEPSYQLPSYQGSQPARQVYAPSSQPMQSAAIAPQALVTLIFKDGRPPEHIHNYLLTARKLTVLDASYRDIPLDQINITATEDANRAAGIDFRTPGGSR